MTTHATSVGSAASATTDAVEHLLAQARRWPLLTGVEEVRLAQRMEAGDQGARERLILSNVRLVVAVARRYRRRGIPLADLVQEGMLGLLRAVEGFDWRRGFRFSTYATIWIRKHVQTVADVDERPLRVPLSLVRRARRVAAIEQDLTVRLGRRPTDRELAAAASLTLDELHAAWLADQHPVALDRPVGDDQAMTIGEMVAADDPPPDAAITARWQTAALAAAVASLPGTERTVIGLRFGQDLDGRGATLAEVGARIGRSAETARQIEERALRRLEARRDLAALRPAA